MKPIKVELGIGLRLVVTKPPRQLNTDENQKKLIEMLERAVQ